MGLFKKFSRRLERAWGVIKYLGVRGLFKTFYYNLKLFPFGQAIHLPLVVSGTVSINAKKNSIELRGALFGTLRIGLQDRQYCYDKPSLFNIHGKLILKGKGLHSFAPGAQVYVGRGATLIIDECFTASHDLKIYCKYKITIGINNMWSYYNIVMDNDGHRIYDEDMTWINTNREIVFGDNVWLGGRCTVLKGSMIPNGCVIGSESLVRKNLEKENSIYSGNGPVLIRENIVWDRKLV